MCLDNRSSAHTVLPNCVYGWIRDELCYICLYMYIFTLGEEMGFFYQIRQNLRFLGVRQIIFPPNLKIFASRQIYIYIYVYIYFFPSAKTYFLLFIIPYVDKISRGFNFADDENFQFSVDLISQLKPPKKFRVDLISRSGEFEYC